MKVWEFFQSNTRRIRHVRVKNIALIDAVKQLDDIRFSEISDKYSGLAELPEFLEYLYNTCLIEDSDIADGINRNPYNRVINFLADYFPSNEVLQAFRSICESHVLIIGVGAVGSWISLLLAQTGVGSFTLCDPDIVKTGNLNRSLFFANDVGERKTDAVTRKLHDISRDIKVKSHGYMIEDRHDIERIFSEAGSGIDLVINASDFPNVDITSEIISRACMEHDVPHIIAGGYNLHLSLIGPTIIPRKTPCYQCIKKGLENEQPEDFSRIRKLHRPRRNIGNCSPLAGISASFATFEALRVLVNSDKLKPLMVGRRGEFNFLTSKLNFSDYSRLPECEWCG